ncbi:outer membrane beta-barrel protein [Rubrivivax gelatinosus]|uniref:OmpA-like transmembrane protein n=1 Tax=Rubrivivax gelatinosus (strain NBRC 100245 / IL144) TaxID=983917 RepID=I0HPQ4_RUBGI|nr:outer membrane beta-barrel protein [Rubrivivax gelatinosus]MBG6081583.1 OOP family OmpA-OmpF porin [Rubrivivax gelatinosus]BAL94991.1 OmpA-like transmembrane protein [Rubrivivax gelatinosus IL144]
MSTRFAKPLVVMSLLAGIGGVAHAEGLYVGGALSAPDYSSRINGFGGGDGGSGPGLKLYGGYHVTPNFAVEGGYFNLGRSHADGTGGTAKAQGVFLDGVASYEFVPKWSVLGSLGVAEGHLKTSDGTDNSPALKVGAGLQYDLNQKTSLRLGYERYRFVNAFDAKPYVGQTTFGANFAF